MQPPQCCTSSGTAGHRFMPCQHQTVETKKAHPEDQEIHLVKGSEFNLSRDMVLLKGFVKEHKSDH